MVINDLIREKNISRYALCKKSGVAMTTITDICSGKTNITKCAAGTLYKIAKALDVTLEYILENYNSSDAILREDFENFKSNVCHLLKEKGDIQFIIEVLEQDMIGEYFKKEWFLETFYLLAMVDYLSRINSIPVCNKYEQIRAMKLEEIHFPRGVELIYMAEGNQEIREDALRNAIPEFLKFNIVESEIRDVY